MTRAVTVAPLAVDDAELARCVSCGLCLPACPTWRVTGFERASPRGRIAAMRAVQWEGAPLDDEFASMMDECVQCRGCEPVCPAFVPFGHLMEGARAALVRARRGTWRRRPWRRLAEWVAYRWVLPHRLVLGSITWLLWISQRLRVPLRRLGVPWLEAGELIRPLRGSNVEGEPVFLFPGCVMDQWLRATHRSAVRVIEAAGGSAVLPERGGVCCGALHLHAGRIVEARRLAQRVMATMPGDAPVLVDSAGCGAAMKDYGRLVRTHAAHAFAARVADVHEWLAPRAIVGLRATGEPVVVQDPCHLRHVQRAEAAVREVVGRAHGVREVDDGGLCCGAGGAYAVLQPALSARIRQAKVDALRRASGGEQIPVVSANPGCILHLRAAGVDARHPLDVVAAALDHSSVAE